MRSFKKLLSDHRGNAAVEYALLVGAISTAVIVPLREIGLALAALFTLIAQALQVG